MVPFAGAGLRPAPDVSMFLGGKELIQNSLGEYLGMSCSKLVRRHNNLINKKAS